MADVRYSLIKESNDKYHIFNDDFITTDTTTINIKTYFVSILRSQNRGSMSWEENMELSNKLQSEGHRELLYTTNSDIIYGSRAYSGQQVQIINLNDIKNIIGEEILNDTTPGTIWEINKPEMFEIRQDIIKFKIK